MTEKPLMMKLDLNILWLEWKKLHPETWNKSDWELIKWTIKQYQRLSRD